MPVFFCKVCGNLLMIEGGKPSMLVCRTCPFRQPLPPFRRTFYEGPKDDNKEEKIEFFDIELQKKMVPKTTEHCPACGYSQAYYHQMQTRSGDEPMTIFYKCCNTKCNKTWKE